MVARYLIFESVHCKFTHFNTKGLLGLRIMTVGESKHNFITQKAGIDNKMFSPFVFSSFQLKKYISLRTEQA